MKSLHAIVWQLARENCSSSIGAMDLLLALGTGSSYNLGQGGRRTGDFESTVDGACCAGRVSASRALDGRSVSVALFGWQPASSISVDEQTCADNLKCWSPYLKQAIKVLESIRKY